MFLAEVLTVLNEGMKRTFDQDYPVEDFRDLHVSIEYPIAEGDYPAVWVGFETQGSLSAVGIGHVTEIVEIQTDDGPRFGEVSLWRFEGSAIFTILSTTSLNRARLMDEVVRTIAFGEREQGRGAFRSYLIDQNLVRIQMNYDTIDIRGLAETPGTPWGTDDLVYEVTLATDVIGEFASTPTGSLVALSEIRIIDYPEGTPDPSPEGWPP
jgi:hypothetical protein